MSKQTFDFSSVVAEPISVIIRSKDTNGAIEFLRNMLPGTQALFPSRLLSAFQKAKKVIMDADPSRHYKMSYVMTPDGRQLRIRRWS